MITDLDVKHAMNRLARVFPQPRDPEGTFEEWKEALRKRTTDITPAELEDAVTEYIATTEDSYGYPRPAQIATIARAKRDVTGWTEPEPEDPPAPSEAVRESWEAAGIDLEDLKRAHRAMKVRRGETA